MLMRYIIHPEGIIHTAGYSPPMGILSIHMRSSKKLMPAILDKLQETASQNQPTREISQEVETRCVAST